MSKAKFFYDSSKRMWYKHFSACCGATLEQKMLFQGKVTKPDFKITSSTKVPIKETVYRKWWQFWKPKSWEVKAGSKAVTTHRDVQFRFFCTKCGKQNDGEWEFVHEDSSPKLDPNKGVSEGQLLLSKSKRAGSSPATPAKFSRGNARKVNDAG